MQVSEGVRRYPHLGKHSLQVRRPFLETVLLLQTSRYLFSGRRKRKTRTTASHSPLPLYPSQSYLLAVYMSTWIRSTYRTRRLPCVGRSRIHLYCEGLQDASSWTSARLLPSFGPGFLPLFKYLHAHEIRAEARSGEHLAFSAIFLFCSQSRPSSLFLDRHSPALHVLLSLTPRRWVREPIERPSPQLRCKMSRRPGSLRLAFCALAARGLKCGAVSRTRMCVSRSFRSSFLCHWYHLGRSECKASDLEG